MALTTSTISGVNEIYQKFFSQIIDATLTSQAKPLDQLSSQRSRLNTLVQAYNTLNTKLTALATAIADLRSGSGSVWSSKAVSVGSLSLTDGTIVTASANSVAVDGAYAISVTSLARAERASSDRQISATSALGLEGTFVIGGAASRSVSDAAPVANTVSAFGTAAVREGQVELGHGRYHVEIRDNDNTLQFRIVDDSGNAISVDDASDSESAMTSGWQDLSRVTGGVFDTGRGLTVTFEPLSDHSVAGVVAAPGIIDGITTSGVREGKTELTSGRYYVEMRENGAGSGDWEYRLVDDSGTTVSIYDTTADNGSFTDGWQDVDDALARATDGVIVTGRGVSFQLGEGPYVAASMGAGAAQVDYTARLTQVGARGDGAARALYSGCGALITVTSDQSLGDIASAINGAIYPAGAGVAASIVDNRLVVTSRSTGAAHAIRLADVTGTVLGGVGASGIGLITAPDTFKNTSADTGYQAATDAVFTVNGVSVTRDRNTGLTGVISGITLSLASDAEGQSAVLTVERNTESIADKVSAFLDVFTALQSHVKKETAVTASGTGVDATYTRNALAGDNTILTALRTSLYAALYRNVSDLPAGVPKNLREIGITLDANLVPVLDANALEAALAADPEGVESLMDRVLETLEERLSPFAGVEGMIAGKIEAVNEQIRGVNERVTQIEERLASQRLVLEKQYSYLLVQLTQMSYSANQMRSYWGL